MTGGPGSWQLIGSTSRGDRVCARGPSIYNDVTAYRDQILQIIGGHGGGQALTVPPRNVPSAGARCPAEGTTTPHEPPGPRAPGPSGGRPQVRFSGRGRNGTRAVPTAVMTEATTKAVA